MKCNSSRVFPCLLLILLFLPRTAEVAAAGPPIAVTDFRGKVLTFAQPVGRVVCLIESALSGIYMLRQGERVVGISTNVYQEPVFKHYAALDRRIREKELAAPGNWDFVSLESVVALQPEVVILWSQQTEVISALEDRGIPVFGVFIKTREDIDREILALGAMLGVPERAARLVQYTQEELHRFSARVADIPPEHRPKAYFMWAQSPLETSGGGSMVDDLVSLAGGRNVAGGMNQEHLVVKLEQVVGWNPEVIIMWPNPRLTPRDIMADEQWGLVTAARRGRVHQLPEVFACDLWTLKYMLTVKMVATWLHPERFADIDPGVEKRRMLVELYGIDPGDF
jgi:iron complex transport system substrate-binding protein